MGKNSIRIFMAVKILGKFNEHALFSQFRTRTATIIDFFMEIKTNIKKHGEEKDI